MEKRIVITKSMALKLAKNLLGKVEYLEKNEIGCYVFSNGNKNGQQIEILIGDLSGCYNPPMHNFFVDENGNSFDGQCFYVIWNIPGVNDQVAYYKLDDMIPILYQWKGDEK